MEFKLIVKKLNNTLSEKETTVFSEWYNESDAHKQYFANVKENYNKDHFLIDIDKGWDVVEKQIRATATKKNNYLKYAVAASVILMLSLTFLFKNNNIEKLTSPIIVNNTIAIGTDKATLTLADGSVVALEKGKQYITGNLKSNGEALVYNATNNPNQEVAYNFLTIPRGGQFNIKLSDGTEVWLNSESQIKYPTNFIEGKTRQVELVYGEAYFDVSPSTDHKGAKFKVLSSVQEIEVIGTEFNIKAYKDEEAIYTTLVEGKVALTNGTTNAFLVPAQQSIIKTNFEGIEIRKADVYNAISWKKGVFSFDNMPLDQIMKVLGRWYDIEVVFADPEIKNIKFNGVLRKNQSIEDILQSIKNVNNLAYDIKNNTVILKKKGKGN